MMESEHEGRRQKIASLEHLTMRENDVAPNGTESLDGESEWIKGQETTKESKCLED